MNTTILITAGATREEIDPVRFLGNRSSGLLGCQLALAGAIARYEVTLLLGDGAIEPTSHPRLRTARFSSTRDLESLMHQHWQSHTYLIMAAAVADFTPKGGRNNTKLRRSTTMSLNLVPTNDLVARAAESAREDQRILAFALGEPADLETSAQEKLLRKQVDAIVANPVQTMHADDISASVYCRDGRTFSLNKSVPKSEFAMWLIKNLKDICQ
ncbi:MAG: phosphopantothenoylcysteine decarboxylase [Phycisphaerales bacterium]|jgi:phosphopantothenoylcysteine decarboxylase/phosphopantothenate--cysteine ligase|nr:phosphopantothenoylcysteine decarboxylase [Phycisphaerales bacterium]